MWRYCSGCPFTVPQSFWPTLSIPTRSGRPSSSRSSGSPFGGYRLTTPPTAPSWEPIRAQPLNPDIHRYFIDGGSDNILYQEVCKVEDEESFYMDPMKKVVVRHRIYTKTLMYKDVMRKMNDPSHYQTILNRVTASGHGTGWPPSRFAPNPMELPMARPAPTSSANQNELGQAHAPIIISDSDDDLAEPEEWDAMSEPSVNGPSFTGKRRF